MASSALSREEKIAKSCPVGAVVIIRFGIRAIATVCLLSCLNAKAISVEQAGLARGESASNLGQILEA